MLNFTVGAKRPANDDARLGAAEDLVRRTLSQHGLMGSGGTPAASQPGGALPNGDNLMQTIQDALSRGGLGGLGGLGKAAGPQAVTPDIPAGATFRNDGFEGRSGRRDYRVYVPSTAGNGVAGCVMMLHGCTQNPEDFARGTGMNALAEEHGLVVIYPEQSRGANAQSCWNWFSKGDQRRDRGEPEILAGIARRVMAEHDVPQDRSFVAGLSAGAAMAVILGETYPDVFAAVGAHSGLPFGAASDVPSAFAAMGGNPASAPAPQASALRTIVFHGSSDSTVHPANGERILEQAEARGPAQSCQTTETGQQGGRDYRRSVTLDMEGGSRSEFWLIEGLGHAWSGGHPGGSHTDPKGPDASAEMIRFFLEPQQRKA
ncbi:alpha/beta hydrolase family esterase [Sulfitobacter aestuarii]|uniref:Alpha/beta hydrolase family esterase n=1 Tax=Sulfitobacter aestuarii TaxID=2161676 RepID=A0ABW5U3U0_9RHOB